VPVSETELELNTGFAKREDKKMEIFREQKTVLRGVNQLARRLGVSRGHLSLVLHGKREASPALSRRMTKLGVSLAERKEQA